MNKHLAADYIEVADARLRAGVKAAAIDLYWKSVEQLATIRNAKNEVELARQIAEPIARISSAIERTAIAAGIERTASKAKAVEFWKTAIMSKQWPDLRDLFESELKRLSAPQ